MKLTEQFSKQTDTVESIIDAAKELYLLESNGRSQIEFHGLTMQPFLQDGDQLTISPVQWDEIRAGDIITYRYKDKYPTYRVLSKEPSLLLMMADNWPNYRAEIRPDEVIGRVIQLKRGDSLLSNKMLAWRISSTRVIWKRRLKNLRGYLFRLLKDRSG